MKQRKKQCKKQSIKLKLIRLCSLKKIHAILNVMEKILMKAYKYKDKLHYESTLDLYARQDNLVILHGPLNRQLIHHTRGKVFTFDRQSLEFYFNDRLYTVACVFNNKGQIEYYYCNIAMPCIFGTKNTNPDALTEITFVDLDLDVIMQKDLTYKIVDRDEFEIHQKELNYPPEIITMAEKGLEWIQKDILERLFPFDGSIDDLVKAFS